MSTASPALGHVCRQHLERFFADHPNDQLHRRAVKALAFVTSTGGPLARKAEGWSAGIVYAVANRDQKACDVPGLLNSELGSAFGVSMETIRRRAAQVTELVEV